MLKKIIKIPAPLVLILIVALIYSNVFAAPFIFDDIKYIVENSFIRDLSNFYSLSGTRYLVFLSFALNYSLGGLSPAGYHLFNIALHALNSILVYLLVRGLFRSLAFGAGGEIGHGADGNEAVRGARDAGFWLAFITALVFASHPIQTEAVTYVSQRFASLAAFFYLLSVVCYIRSRLAFLSQGKGAGLALYLIAFMAGLLAQKSKETAFTLPAVIILVEFLFFQQGRLSLKKGGGFALPFLGLFAIIPLELFYLNRGGGAGGIADKLRLLQLEELETLSRSDYLLTQFRVLLTYIRLLFLPFGQNGDYDYALYHSFFTPPVFFSFVSLAIIFVMAIYFALRSARRGRALPLLAAFGALWFFITISVESSIVPIKDVIFEHRLYLPSAGVFLSLLSLYFAFFGRKGRAAKGRGVSRGLIIFPLIVVLLLSVLTYRRNRVWRSDMAFWGDVVSKSSEKPRGYNNLGNVYYNRGKVEEAINNYRRAITLNSDDYEAYNNLGSALLALNLADMALRNFRRALEIRPDYTGALSNMALVLVALNRPGEAIGYARAALALRPGLAAAHNALGMSLVDSGDMERGIAHLKEAARLNPASGHLLNNLGLALLRAGRADEAVEALKKALALEPANERFRENLEMAGKGSYFLLEKRK